MSTIMGSLNHLLATANKVHIIWYLTLLIIMLTLAVLHHFWKNDSKKLMIWRFLCLTPVLISGIHAVIYVVGVPMFFEEFILMYIIALLALIPMLFAKRKTGYRISAVLTAVASCFCGFYFCLSSPNIFNHTRESYTESFHSLAMEMDEHYVLKEWKKVDFSALEAKYMPEVREAEQEQDPMKYFKTVDMFCNELHDGHVGSWVGFDFSQYQTGPLIHDYGFAMIRLDNDDIIAVCTSAEANAVGIEDGTVITKWNGKHILQAATEDAPDIGYSVKPMQTVLLLWIFCASAVRLSRYHLSTSPARSRQSHLKSWKKCNHSEMLVSPSHIHWKKARMLISAQECSMTSADI